MSGDRTIPVVFDADNVFETCRVERGRIRHLPEHLRRLAASMKTAGMTGVALSEIEVKLRQRAGGIRKGALRAAVWRTGSSRVLIHAYSGTAYPASLFRKGVSVRTVPTRCPGTEPVAAQIKGSDRLSSVLARIEGGPAFEALRMGRHGFLTEGTVSNLFLVREGVLTTTPGWLGVLEGVTRAEILSAARRLGIPIRTIPVTRHELFNAEEAFLTNVLMRILPVREVDGRRIGVKIPGPITRRLKEALR